MLGAEWKIEINAVANLNSLKGQAIKRIEKAALKEGGRPILQDARTNVRVQSGALKQSLSMKFKEYSKSVIGLIGPRSDFEKQGRRPAWYAHFLEQGTSKQAAEPFLLPALEAHREEYMQTVGRIMGERLMKELCKRRK